MDSVSFEELSTVQTLVAIGNTLDAVSVCGRQNIANMDGCFRALDALVQRLNREEAEKKMTEEPQTVNKNL